MEGKMKAAVMTDLEKMEMRERNIPTPGDSQVLVKIKHVGICGSDLHFFEHGEIGSFQFARPLILGHESAGEVIEVGQNVQGVKPGDLVALEPGTPCGICEFCLEGKYNLCPAIKFMAIPETDGAFVEYVVHPALMTFKLPENVDTVAGALLEPLAVGLHAVRISRVELEQRAVILGAGCIGLITLMVLKAMGLTDIYVVDLIDKRLEKAKELGAKEIINARETDIIEKVMKLTDGEGVDRVFETAGEKVTINQTAYLVKRGGIITIVGMAGDIEIPFNFSAITWKEAIIKTVFRYRNLYPAAIKAVTEGLIPLKKIVSNYFSFEDIAKGIRYNLENKKDVIKAVIEFE